MLLVHLLAQRVIKGVRGALVYVPPREGETWARSFEERGGGGSPMAPNGSINQAAAADNAGEGGKLFG